MYYYETNCTDPCFNLAFEEYLLERKRKGDILMLWQNANTVVVGLNQNTVQEIDPVFVHKHGITVVRRTTGGGAVYHDMGNLNYSFITDLVDAENMSIASFSKPVCDALAELGVNAEVSGRNDIIVEGKKVSGVAQRIYKGRILHHGTLLFKTDPTMISGALKVDPSKFSSKSTKSVRNRVGNIKDYLSNDMSLAEFWEHLRINLCGDDTRVCMLTDEELAVISRNAENKYRSWDWTYGCSPKFNYCNSLRFRSGLVEVKLMVEKGVITAVSFSGDFMAVVDSSAAVNTLMGTRYDREEVSAKLCNLDIASMFGDVSDQELLSVIFGES